MWEKIKGYLNYAVGVVLGLLVIAVSALWGVKRRDEDKIAELEGKSELRDALEKQEQARKEADSAEKDYETLRDSYLREHGDSGAGK